ncbi:MAG TPA: AbrB/MazE/SpoVT family DNA-binding domain-containing protein [Gemmataceae bacterium]|jgi:antitoxin MazE
MKTRIIRIGNSRGIRIPKLILEQIGPLEEVEMRVEGDLLVIHPLKKKPRAGWARAFQEMAQAGDDKLLDPDVPALTAWDEDEWEWR